MKRIVFAFLAAALWPCALTAEKPGFGFGQPEVLKLDWSTRSLTISDLDGDGLRDMAVINNDTARIELLYQLAEGDVSDRTKKVVSRNRWDPILEDARFENRAITVGFPMFDLSVGDLNGDGLVDLAYSAREVPLTVRYQTEDGDWIDSREFDGFEALGWTNTVRITDFDADGRNELIVISTDAIRIFQQDNRGELEEPELLYISGENPFNLMVNDATGDGLLDLLYLCTDGKQVLAMREQAADGSFGPEMRHVMERPARIIEPMPRGKGGTGFTVIDSRSGTLEFMELKEKEAEGRLPSLIQGSPDIYPIFKKVREPASYALGDLNGDGEMDLAVANPGEAEVVIFLKEKGRFQASKAFPSLSSVSSLAMGRFHKGKRQSLIATSAEEKAIGVSRLDEKGRLTFPRQLQIGEGDPVVCEAVDLNGDGYDELALVIERESGNYSLVLAAPVNRKSAGNDDWEVIYVEPLKDVRRKPEAIAVLDTFPGKRPGLIIYVPREAPVLLAPGESEYLLVPVAVDSNIRESLLKGILPAQTSVFDADADGVKELVVARTGFARAFRFTRGQLEMVDQFNARRGKDEVSAVIPMMSGSRVTGMVLYVAGEGEMQYLKRNADGVFRYNTAAEVGRIDLIGWHALADGSGHTAHILTGEDRFWLFGGQAKSMTWEIGETYESDLEDIHYSHVASGDFDRDGSLELIALDGNEHVVDVLSRFENQWTSLMYWEVFEQNMHYQGRTGAKLEPRQIVIEELTGDGRLDFAFLVHDRILIYPQE